MLFISDSVAEKVNVGQLLNFSSAAVMWKPHPSQCNFGYFHAVRSAGGLIHWRGEKQDILNNKGLTDKHN